MTDIYNLITKYKNELDSLGLAYFIVLEEPKTNQGCSIYEGKNLNKASTNARQCHIEWEKRNNIKP